MTRIEQETPITPDEIALAMAPFAPFESAPHIGVAVSGGADSMALALLLHNWAQARGGRITAVIVEHGLRAESSAEAVTTAARLTRRGIAVEILYWRGAKPESGIQAEARRARYDLLDDWCRRYGVLHLAVAHHADDQAETFLMRLARGSGPDGLAAMAPVRELTACRLLRPVLDFPKARLVATLRATGVDWAEDPSNRNPKYGRTHVRTQLAGASDDSNGYRLATARFSRARRALEAACADWLARHASLHPAGFLTFDRAAWTASDDEIRLRVLARAALAIGGKAFAPDIRALERLAATLETGRGATLGRARFDPDGKDLGVYREARNLPNPMTLSPGTVRWDRRFSVMVADTAPTLTIRPWTSEIAADWPKNHRPAWLRQLPERARAGVPILQGPDGYHVALGQTPGSEPDLNGVSIGFAPTMPLSGSGFSVA